ncbi:hypothetical protein Tco_0699350 [Tanacetum coccineum]
MRNLYLPLPVIYLKVTAQAKEIASLKKRVKQLEQRWKSRTSGLKRLRKVGSASRVESFNDVSLGAQEDASKQERKIADLDADAKVTLIDETQERYDEEMLFDVQDDLQGEEVITEKEVVEKEVSAADPITIAGEVVTTASATTTIDELTLAQTLIEIKAVKPKAITTAATTITTIVASTKPKAKGIVFHDQEEQASVFTPIVSSSQLPQAKDKGKGKCSERAGDELESDKSKKQKIDEHVEAEKDDDQKEAEMKKHIEIVKDDEVEIDAIPLATKPPMIVEYKIDKDERMGYFKLIRANGSSKRHSSMIKMLQDINREDLETLWKLVKAKHGNTRPEEDYERVLWGDLKVMFEPDIKSEIWRNLQVTMLSDYIAGWEYADRDEIKD